LLLLLSALPPLTMCASYDPAAVFGRFLDRQSRAEQFSEEIGKVVHSSANGTGALGNGLSRTPAATAAGRHRSPGLAAGAALALTGGATASEAYAEAHAARRQSVDYARRRDSPFDDHSKFGARVGEIGPRQPHLPPPLPSEASSVHAASKLFGREIRSRQEKVGAGAPFDAPERGRSASSGCLAASAAAAAAAATPQARADAHSEMVRNKLRMRGTKDLIFGSGVADSHDAGRSSSSIAAAAQLRNSSLPPRGSSLPPRMSTETTDLLPQAHFRLQYEGGSAIGLSGTKAAYLNSSVMKEDNRFRNGSVSLQLA